MPLLDLIKNIYLFLQIITVSACPAQPGYLSTLQSLQKTPFGVDSDLICSQCCWSRLILFYGHYMKMLLLYWVEPHETRATSHVLCQGSHHQKGDPPPQPTSLHHHLFLYRDPGAVAPKSEAWPYSCCFIVSCLYMYIL